MKRLIALLVSIRTSAALMIVVALMLLASVVTPQRAILGDAAVDGIAESSRLNALLIDTLGLGAIATSPLFFAALALFYINLLAVLLHRFPSTLGKTRVRVPSPEAVEKWTAAPHAIDKPLPGGANAAAIVTTLRGFGYRPHRVTASALYAVKHRYAAIGFLLFHLSFFLLCASGLLIWYTRWVGELRVVEGQSVEAKSARVVRQRPAGGVPDVAFTLDAMKPAFVGGEATDLRAALRFEGAPPIEAWVNHPAQRGHVSVLVSDVGIAPVFWLQDRRGFGVDRVAAPTDRSTPVDVPLASGVVDVRIFPPERSRAFPSRDELAKMPVTIAITEGGREAFRGSLRPGEAATLAGGRVVLTEIRYWGGLKIVSERGGALLIAGFVLATIGATWRLLLHRRDVVVAWDSSSFRIAGHGEWFVERDRRELEELSAAIARRHETPSPSIDQVEVNA